VKRKDKEKSIPEEHTDDGIAWVFGNPTIVQTKLIRPQRRSWTLGDSIGTNFPRPEEKVLAIRRQKRTGIKVEWQLTCNASKFDIAKLNKLAFWVAV
jgi:hypothetical protein